MAKLEYSSKTLWLKHFLYVKYKGTLKCFVYNNAKAQHRHTRGKTGKTPQQSSSLFLQNVSWALTKALMEFQFTALSKQFIQETAKNLMHLN